MIEEKSCFTHQTAMKSTTTSLVPALVISDWKCPSFSITMTFPVAVAILSKERVLWPRRTEAKRITISLKPLISIIVDHRDVDKTCPLPLWFQLFCGEVHLLHIAFRALSPLMIKKQSSLDRQMDSWVSGTYGSPMMERSK